MRFSLSKQQKKSMSNVPNARDVTFSKMTPLFTETMEKQREHLEKMEEVALKKAEREGQNKENVKKGRRWLVGIDGSENSESALFFALKLLDKDKDTLFILTIVQDKSPRFVLFFFFSANFNPFFFCPLECHHAKEH